ncbi:twin-arginine translocase TatA/TatE family subunit [Glycomyces sp. TRM65418]|uniref:twin-arginine translocase TatA/TatE family subunit n=1 Tax=Glycomyces sp. TRM65418 TaxID=2867006 RepID=UPI001CE66DCF|nr:twin-arginine translocase TatA/TatE family subunit [Glycomyces sp. TRM65418]MCC3765753.1 twin-arginine translocase TatA/TatE family subunit [Glycomyces sp. TRM65418]QZD55343.1 twin-arginine translocase TatA/TatE family subunit [Glycomyces sp. TRM65418]
MFGGLGGTEFLVIILIAIFLWGPDKLPKALANLRRFISKARTMASNAAADLSREIGTDIRPEDLNPKTFVRKHILTEEDQEMLTSPLKSTMRDLQEGTKPLQEGLRDTTREVENTRRSVNRGSITKSANGSSAAGAGANGAEAAAAEPAAERTRGRAATFDDVT